VSSVAITLCIASQRVFIVVSVYFIIIQSGNFWLYPRINIMLDVDIREYSQFPKRQKMDNVRNNGSVTFHILLVLSHFSYPVSWKQFFTSYFYRLYTYSRQDTGICAMTGGEGAGGGV